MSTLAQIVIAHHTQAAHMASRQGDYSVDNLRRIGNRFTTRVEKRLRRLEAHGRKSMATPQEHVVIARTMARYLSGSDLVRTALIDDWGRDSNFTLIVYPVTHDRHTTTRLKALVKRVCAQRSDIHMRDCFPPEPIRKWCAGEERTRIVGYHADYWKFDLDFRRYDAASNSFAA